MSSWATTPRSRSPQTVLPAPPGKLLIVEERQVHVMIDGPEHEETGVVFESALGCACTEWVRVQQALAMHGVRSVAYDRPGVGWSSENKRIDRASEHADRLAALLEHLGVREAVLVGHSVGGLLVRSFWRRHPEKVAGIVLIDSSHPEQHVRSSRQREGLRALRAQMHRARGQRATIPFDGDVTALPAPFGQLTHAAATSPVGTRTTLRELDAWQRTWAADAARATDLRDLPLAVVTAGDVARRDPAHALLQRELARLSSTSRHVVIDEATHQGLVMRSEFAPRVATEIAALVRKR